MRFLISAWIAGQLFSLFLGDPYKPWDLIISCGVCFAVYLYWQKKKDFQARHLTAYFFSALLIGCMGFMWTQWLTTEKPQPHLAGLIDGRTWVVQGYIDELPRQMDRAVQFGFQVTQWKSLQASQNNTENQVFPKRISLLYPSLDKAQELLPGRYWEFKVQLKPVRGLKNPYGFDLEQWMYIQNFGAQGKVQKGGAKRLEGFHHRFSTYVEWMRLKIRQKIQSSLGKQAQYAGVMSALVIGDQQMIGAEDWQIFAKTGIGHLISISGLHVTMLAGFAAGIALLLIKSTRLIYWQPAPYLAAFIGFKVAFLYTWLAGFQIPAQRTMMMVGVSSLGLYLGRHLHAFDIWFWALFLVLTCHPWAIYSPGFWLSFGAVAAILFAMPKDQAGAIDIDLLWIQKLKTSLGEAVRVQAVVTIALIPLSLFWFYQISLVSPLANAIAIPVVSFLVTPLAMLGAFLPWILGDFCLWCAHAIFSVLMYFIAPLAQMEWSSIHAAKPPGWHLVLACIGVVICIRPGVLLESWLSRFIGLLICLSLWLPREYLPNHIPYGELEMTVWDIGQGNAVLIKTQSHQLLFDTGPVSFGKFDPAEKVIIPHLRASGIHKIDQLVISHQDADHIGGLGYLLKHFPIQRAMGSIAPDHQVQQLFKKNKVLLEKCQIGQSWSWDGIDFYVWHPQLQMNEVAQYKSTKPNDMSCVIEARLKHHSIWLTGDIEKNAERLMIERLIEDQTELKAIQKRNVILMAPHHGSKTSSTPMLLEYLNPGAAFSQTGYKNRYQHPHPDVVGRYQNQDIKLQDTVQTGAQIWRTQGSEITFRQYRKPADHP